MPSAPRLWVHRHSAVVRVTHWVNVVALTVLLMSGLQIFNAHPALYWGQSSDFDRPWLSMSAVMNEEGEVRGVTSVFGRDLDTTGALGLSGGLERGFPAWATLPGPQWLAMGRRWHLFFAWVFVINGLVYLASGLASGHFRRDLLPTGAQLRHMGRTIADHARLRFPKGEEARHYNVLQKLAYLVVIFLLLPVIALAGMAMSPHLDSLAPFLLDLFDGRQSARSVHFIVATLLVAFFLVHVLMV
ncbi:MAG TPA: cytochrome b/b6 domain-containing protein, partial [Magnetospirillum sp.]|nr:cytochrome b/b6 domain-containing protein [Magnetospirillum sp.]